jgi:hypothetical protein
MNPTVFDRCLSHLSKHAEEQEGDGRRYLNALKHVGAGVLGYGAGTAAGKGLGLLAGKVDRGGLVPGAGIARTVAPLAGAGLGVAYSLWKAHENEAIQRALKGSPSSAQPGLSGQ